MGTLGVVCHTTDTSHHPTYNVAGELSRAVPLFGGEPLSSGLVGHQAWYILNRMYVLGSPFSRRSRSCVEPSTTARDHPPVPWERLCNNMIHRTEGPGRGSSEGCRRGLRRERSKDSRGNCEVADNRRESALWPQPMPGTECLAFSPRPIPEAESVVGQQATSRSMFHVCRYTQVAFILTALTGSPAHRPEGIP